MLIAVEAYLVLMRREGVFVTEGRHRYEVAELSRGDAVAHSFLMRGEGLNAIRVRLTSPRAPVNLTWTLWRGAPEMPEAPLTKAYEATEVRELRGGPQWIQFDLPRDSSSHDRWYTFELKLTPGSVPPSGGVTISASHDNPDRGGVLWVAGTRKPGSLLIRAYWMGKTPYQRFESLAEPYLFPVLQVGAIQILAVVAIHLSLLVFAYSVLGLDAAEPAVVGRGEE
jgi:hypothetical protein